MTDSLKERFPELVNPMDANLATLEIAVRKEFPDFEIIEKSSSFKMRVINGFLLVITFGQMKKFMETFVTTVGAKVYVPTRWKVWSEQSKIGVLRHERVHMRQAQRYTRPFFSFLYLFFPFPVFFAYYRMKFEREAYEESMRVEYHYSGAQLLNDPEYKQSMVGHFTTNEYFWMWPFKGGVERWYDGVVAGLQKAP